MRNFIIYLIFLFIGISILSCERHVDGKWEDNIKLSSKDIVCESFQQSFTITTHSTGWWQGGISLNGVDIDLTNTDRFSKNFVITHSDFQVERKDDGKKIIILMNQNKTNSDKTLIISLQNGDYFDRIKVTQRK